MFKSKEEAYKEGLSKNKPWDKMAATHKRKLRAEQAAISGENASQVLGEEMTHTADDVESEDPVPVDEQLKDKKAPKKRKKNTDSNEGLKSKPQVDNPADYNPPGLEHPEHERPKPGAQNPGDPFKKSDLVKSLFDNGHRESALLLQNWGEMDAQAEEMSKGVLYDADAAPGVAAKKVKIQDIKKDEQDGPNSNRAQEDRKHDDAHATPKKKDKGATPEEIAAFKNKKDVPLLSEHAEYDNQSGEILTPWKMNSEKEEKIRQEGKINVRMKMKQMAGARKKKVKKALEEAFKEGLAKAKMPPKKPYGDDADHIRVPPRPPGDKPDHIRNPPRESPIKKDEDEVLKPEQLAAYKKKKEVNKSDLVKSLFDAGHRESALRLQNWDEMDANAEALVKARNEDGTINPTKPIKISAAAKKLKLEGAAKPERDTRTERDIDLMRTGHPGSTRKEIWAASKAHDERKEYDKKGSLTAVEKKVV